MLYNDALFNTCRLIEYIGRVTKNNRKDVVSYMKPDIKRIYSYADVFHCETIAKVADDFITRNIIPVSSYDNVAKAMYYGLYYQPRDYFAECYREGRILPA